jgi:hypothetical protein
MHSFEVSLGYESVDWTTFSTWSAVISFPVFLIVVDVVLMFVICIISIALSLHIVLFLYCFLYLVFYNWQKLAKEICSETISGILSKTMQVCSSVCLEIILREKLKKLIFHIPFRFNIQNDPNFIRQEKFKDTKGVSRSSKFKKYRQYNDQRKYDIKTN